MYVHCEPCGVELHDKCIVYSNPLVVCHCYSENHRMFHLVDTESSIYRRRVPANEGAPKEFDYEREVYERMKPVAQRPDTDEQDAFEVNLRYEFRQDD
jgi:hypothetical protein